MTEFHGNPRTFRPDVDYFREKYALVALAEYLRGAGWDVLLSVPPRSLVVGAAHEGIPPPLIDAELDRVDERYRYNFYTDIGGRVDLVGWRKDEVLLIEGKGTSAKPQAALEQLVGRMILWMEPDRPELKYGIAIPDHRAWLKVVARASHPILHQIAVFAIDGRGDVRVIEWGTEA
jgi:hypothetical protein